MYGYFWYEGINRLVLLFFFYKLNTNSTNRSNKVLKICIPLYKLLFSFLNLNQVRLPIVITEKTKSLYVYSFNFLVLNWIKFTHWGCRALGEYFFNMKSGYYFFNFLLVLITYYMRNTYISHVCTEIHHNFLYIFVLKILFY